MEQNFSYEANNRVVKKFPYIYDPECSLAYFQESATGSYNEPDEFDSHFQTLFPNYLF